MNESYSFENTDLNTLDFLRPDVPLTGFVSADLFVGMSLLGWILYRTPSPLRQCFKHFVLTLHRKHIIAFSPRASRLSHRYYLDL